MLGASSRVRLVHGVSLDDVVGSRICQRAGCGRAAVAGLVFDYSQARVQVGPLREQRDPAVPELCLDHAGRFTAPHGWQVTRLVGFTDASALPRRISLAELADEIRMIGLRGEPVPRFDQALEPEPDPDTVVELARRGHLRVLMDAERAS